MIANDKHQCANNFLFSAETIAIFYISYQCTSMLEVTVNFVLHGCHCNRLLRHFIP